MIFEVLISLNLLLTCCDRWSQEEDLEPIVASAAKAYNIAQELLLPNVAAALKVVCVLPVTSNEAERSFSRMKLIKTAIRSTMTDTRYDFVLVIQIHHTN